MFVYLHVGSNLYRAVDSNGLKFMTTPCCFHYELNIRNIESN